MIKIKLLLISTALLSAVFLTGLANDDAINVYILYPRAKGDNSYHAFFNKRYITKVRYGDRYVASFKEEGNLLVVIQETDVYEEHGSLDKKTRNIFLKKGRNYFFQVNGKGELDYLPDAEKGSKLLEDANKFSTSLKEIEASVLADIFKK